MRFVLCFLCCLEQAVNSSSQLFITVTLQGNCLVGAFTGTGAAALAYNRLYFGHVSIVNPGRLKGAKPDTG